MWAVSANSILLAAVAAQTLISVPDIGQNNGLAFVGMVTDPNQTPLGREVVTLSSNDRVLQTCSTVRGQFRFENVPRGTYDLECSAPGFARQKFYVDLSNADAPPLAIVVLQHASQPEMEACGPHPSIAYSSADPKSPRLAGIIRSYENRKPLRRAELVLTLVDDPRITSHTVADNQGGFRFEHLAAGRYDLRVSRPGYLPTQVKTLLVPHENSITVDVPMRRDDKKLIVCQ
jgi:hypothetical protein